MKKEEVVASIKEAETATMEKLRNLASKMVRIEENIATFVSPHRLKNENVFLPYLAKNAELARLQLEVNDAICNHVVHCPCGCSVSMKLRELNYFEHRENKFFVKDCDNSFSEWGTPLTDESQLFVEGLLRYSFVRPQDLFDK